MGSSSNIASTRRDGAPSSCSRPWLPGIVARRPNSRPLSHSRSAHARTSLPPLLPGLWVPRWPLCFLPCPPFPALPMAPSSDVAVYTGFAEWIGEWDTERIPRKFAVPLKDKLACAGFQVEDASWSVNPRVLVLFIDRGSMISYEFMIDLTKFMERSISSGTPLIPVFLDMKPSELQDVELGPFASSFSDRRSDFGDFLEHEADPRKWGDAVRQVSSITGHELARYDGDGDKLRYEVLIEVSRVINTGRIAEFNEVRTQNQLFKQRVSDKEEEARQARRMVVSHLKVLAGELVKHAMDNVCSTSSRMTSHRGKPSRRFTSNVHYREIQKVAKRFSIRSREFAELADQCIDARNKVAHCQGVDWRRSSALPDAVKFINRYPDVKEALPDQCEIILGYKDICSEFRL